MDTQNLMDEACSVISDGGWQYYFDPATTARGERLGLDTFEFYFLGRGGVLGDVEAPVVASAFGYFNPAVLAIMWNAARAKIAPRDAGREYFEAAHDFGRAKLTGLAELPNCTTSAIASIRTSGSTSAIAATSVRRSAWSAGVASPARVFATSPVWAS